MASELTAPQRRALGIVRAGQPITAAVFARRMWPGSADQRDRVTETIRGNGGITAKATAFLNRLFERGLVDYITDGTYTITPIAGEILQQLAWKRVKRADGHFNRETVNEGFGASWIIYPPHVTASGMWSLNRVIDHDRWWGDHHSLTEAKQAAQKTMDVEAREEARRQLQGRTP